MPFINEKLKIQPLFCFSNLHLGRLTCLHLISSCLFHLINTQGYNILPYNINYYFICLFISIRLHIELKHICLLLFISLISDKNFILKNTKKHKSYQVIYIVPTRSLSLMSKFAYTFPGPFWSLSFADPTFEQTKSLFLMILLDRCQTAIQLWFTGWKVSKYGVFSGPYFPVFELNTEIYGVNFRIQSEYSKTLTKKAPYLDTFHVVIT